MSPIPQLRPKIYSPEEWRNNDNKKIKKDFFEKKSFMQRFSRHGGNRKKRNFKEIIRYALVIFCAAFLAGSIGLAILFVWVGRNLPNPDNLSERMVAQSTKIYDRKGETVLYDIHGAQKRTLVKLADLPAYIPQATVALEDKKFYEHHGFDPVGFARALMNNVLHGFGSGGGSTITQQLVKNAILTSEKKLSRKIKELVLSYRIEGIFTKDEILQMYLNEIPYGSVSYGIEAAAQTFFGKSAKDLTLSETAIIVSLPQATSLYSPYGSHTDRLLVRAHYALDQMVEMGYISQEQADEAKKDDALARIIPRKENILAPHFVMYIKEILTETYGEKTVEQGGLKVITTLDLEKQLIAEKAIANQEAANEKDWKATNAALVAIDPKTGQILAMVGSKDYFNEDIDGAVNVVTRARQPGSSFKPIVYAAAFKKGYTPTTIIYDVDTKFKTEIGEDYEPHNYNFKTFGPVTIKQALAGSLNTPAVKAIYITGVANVLDLADSMGYTTFRDRSRFGLSLVLGGGEVKLLEHASAFGVFATEGEKHKTAGILKVLDANGRTLEEWEDSKEAVLDTEICRQITGILSDNEARAYVFGANNWLTLGERPVAAKTGTTNDFHDAWTIGFTPSLVAGVWVGNSNNDAMKAGADGSKIAAPIWNEFMRESLKTSPIETFTPALPVVTGKAVLDGYIPPRRTMIVDTRTNTPADSSTPPEYVSERVVQELHSILQYINKENPRGPTPANPADDIQYEYWEQAIRDWAIAQGIYPLDYGDTQNYQFTTQPENNTEITFDDTTPVNTDNKELMLLSPKAGEHIKNKDLKISFYIPPTKKLFSVEYYLSGLLLEKDGPSDLKSGTIVTKDVKILDYVPAGEHELKLRFTDSDERIEERMINFFLD
jgi:1A family penicillin-binding protein